jgi:hypothetical protein
MPRRCNHGFTIPQHQNVTSIERLMTNRPCAAASAVYPATRAIHGPAHSDCTAIIPP